MNEFETNIANFNQFVQEVNLTILTAAKNPTTLPLVLKTIAAITRAVASSGGDISADLEALQDLAAINQNIIDASIAVKSHQVTA